MRSHLTCLGVIWIILSLASAITICIGFFSATWIEGVLYDPIELRNVTAHMSSFRRCNYPQMNMDGQSYIALTCGRYSSFNDIPSVWWQLTTVLMAVGCAVSIYVAVRAVLSLCLAYVLDTSSARALGRWQFVALCTISGGGVLFPLGWDHLEVQEVCGYLSSAFKLGSCQLGSSVYMLTTSLLLLFSCFCLSCCSVHTIEPS